MLGTKLRGPLSRGVLHSLLAPLSACEDLTLDGSQVTASTERVGLVVRVEDDGDGFRVVALPDPRITATLADGVVLRGDTLCPAAPPGLSGRELEDLSRGQRFEAGRGRAAGDGGAALAAQPASGRDRDPAAAAHGRAPAADPARGAAGGRGARRSTDSRVWRASRRTGRRRAAGLPGRPGAAARRGRGAPPGAAARAGSRAAAGPPGARDRRRGDRARGAARSLPGRDPRGCAPSLRAGAAARGEPPRRRPGFRARVRVDARRRRAPRAAPIPLACCAPGARARATSRSRAAGSRPCPADWLARYGDRVADLLAARGERGALPRCALPDLARLCDALGTPRPPGFEALRALVEGFSGAPPRRAARGPARGAAPLSKDRRRLALLPALAPVWEACSPTTWASARPCKPSAPCTGARWWWRPPACSSTGARRSRASGRACARRSTTARTAPSTPKRT